MLYLQEAIALNKIDEYMINRLGQCKAGNTRFHEMHRRKWNLLDLWMHHAPISRDDKLDFIRFSLESYRISDTTIDILFRRMIRWTLPSWVSNELLPEMKQNGSRQVASESVPGLFYTVSRIRCDCPGYRGHGHCHHHDE